ncbi:MAG: hypothetical protein A3C43_00170 [Candidatus Schekmanbacteria bacterium RIFCSPHIGHO2_02_FULL_38_11]|uniref:Nitroreductase domain-containing protein n=1 Tax=Candidatus Schekmanbacteria bacterium RIFCSPLOWO2_12_FULL_38_15 TaxID=1817883 RepID=A0A1F7SCY7_9BACT|nr:MAG: hypothetical protein A2043_05555 [Candidatus Schekmanbacteria bacterium GWA2_38_9]OGL48769.1 MAG: hypothetical protein A3H37_06550 [Candidatus Schekmanbacteria bacterium RIFCSPLOWO2_02_FULL_38_14]OGL51640.1 MAG: hypothetical protein A3G31_05900 [Candidatus Schekmanbacteria bacterium RIFCSPLOWO2_12_FULL_38_15]OGL55372.1 MAG: hypothetical protein A3C43_00170 [Candidatus Schekmanbacteria bacterium RIFCSPHIGHO2_02_FULL_38_11]
MKDNYGDDFQQKSKYHQDKLKGRHLDWDTKPETYKVYKDVKTISLPETDKDFKSQDLFAIIRKRHSVRLYSKTPLSLKDLSYLLWCSTGIQRVEQGYEFRTAPSAGALYPIETYLVVNNVKSLNPGIYHYAIQKHQLEVLKEGQFGKDIAISALGQRIAMDAPVVFVWTAVFQRSKWKYDQRAYRYIYLDAGHIAENLAMAAVDLKLGSCQIGALYDDEINDLIGIDGIEESVIYLSVAGHPAQTK